MRVLIIGGTRFIGPPLAVRLAGAGHEVTVLHRGETEADLPSSVAHLHGDRHRLEALAPDLRKAAPDVVIDTSAYTEQDALEAVSAFRGIARRLVALSSQDVYRAYGRLHGTEPGPPEPVPLTEDAPLREQLYPDRGKGRGMEDYDKVLVERAVMGNPDLPTTVLRLPMVYGERDYQRRIAVELRRMDDNRPAIVLEEPFASWRWTRGYVENVAAAIALAATRDDDAGRIYNVGDAEARSYADWVRALGQAADWRGKVIVVPQGRLPAQLRPPKADYAQHLVADTSRIRGELGFVDPVPFYQGLSRAIEWERRQRAERAPGPLDYAAEDALITELRNEAMGAKPPSAEPTGPEPASPDQGRRVEGPPTTGPEPVEGPEPAPADGPFGPRAP